MSEQAGQPTDFITARELNMAVSFLSEKIDTGFRVTHEKQDHTNGRLRAAEATIAQLQGNAQAEQAVKEAAEKIALKYLTWKVAAVSTFGTSVVGSVGYAIKKLIFG
jgi:uncharacterized protein YcbX